MRFQELQDHIQDYGCTVDRMEGHRQMATNQLNLCQCEIDDEDDLIDINVIHICYQLKIPAPERLALDMRVYRRLREEVIKDPVKEDK